MEKSMINTSIIPSCAICNGFGTYYSNGVVLRCGCHGNEDNLNIKAIVSVSVGRTPFSYVSATQFGYVSVETALEHIKDEGWELLLLTPLNQEGRDMLNIELAGFKK